MYKALKPFLFNLDSEKVHDQMLTLVSFLEKTKLVFALKPFFVYKNFSLNTNFLGIDLKNPTGLAAGFDKSATALSVWKAMGFGFIEAGNITARASVGNPKPRLFRLEEDKGLVNRIGLANIGADAMAKYLQTLNCNLPFGINIAKTHDPKILGDKAVEDFIYTFKKLYGFGSYITLNISCPNTVEGKTFEQPEALKILLNEIFKAKNGLGVSKPILVKISPDVTFQELEVILEICEAHKIDGYVLTNTTKDRDNLKTNKNILEQIGKGGVSGRPLRQKSTELVRYAYKMLKRPCIIGLGGIDSADAAYERIKAGASIIQIYTGLIYEGPGLVKKINQGLVKLLQRDGLKKISEAVGVEA